jgi:hypothetical protein
MASVEVVNVAWPPLSPTVPSVWLVVVSVKVTLPVSVPWSDTAVVTCEFFALLFGEHKFAADESTNQCAVVNVAHVMSMNIKF